VVAVVGLFNSGLLPSLSSPSSKEKESSTNSAELSRSDAFSDDVKVDAIANPDDPDLSNSSSEMFARERNVARWVLENGGEVTVNYQTDDGWHGTRVTLVEALPAAPFVIQMIDLSNTVLSAQEQRQLGRLHELEGLHLNDRGTSDDVIFNLNPQPFHSRSPPVCKDHRCPSRNFFAIALWIEISRNEIPTRETGFGEDDRCCRSARSRLWKTALCWPR
jgi:hypothetical protein